MPGLANKNIEHTTNGFGVKGWCIFPYAGIPDGTVGINFAGPGSICVDTLNANMYLNSGTKTAPVWKLVTRAA